MFKDATGTTLCENPMFGHGFERCKHIGFTPKTEHFKCEFYDARIYETDEYWLSCCPSCVSESAYQQIPIKKF